MKRVLSLILCMIMCLSVFSVTAGQVYALGDAKQAFSVTTDGFADDEITFNISISAGNTKVIGVILQAAFDSNALEVVEAGAAGSYNAEGDFVENVSGLYETGIRYDNDGIYALGYMNANGYTTSSARNMFTITFRAISAERNMTSVEFYCVEFITDDGNDNNNITKADDAQTFGAFSFNTLSQPMVTEVNSVGTGLSVMWTKSIGADSYTLYRKTANTQWAPLNVEIDGEQTSYIDDSISQGTEYYYTISAKNSCTETLYDTNGVAGMNFGTIASVEAAAVETGAKIKWSALAGAEKYEILRKLSSSDSWQVVASTKNCEYIDESIASGVAYDYRVRAIQGKYAAGMAGEPITVIYIGTSKVYVCNTNGGIEVSFDEVGGAEKYLIERSVNGGAYTLVAELSEADSYFDEDTIADNTYSYTVQAVASVGTGGKAKSESITRLGTPIISSITNIVDGVELKWNAVSGATKYVVYRRVDGGEWITLAKSTTTSYEDNAVESGKEYIYAVSAENATGDSGFETTSSILYLATPSIVSVSTVGEGIKVVWNAVSGASGYTVYRANVNSNNWTVIGTTSEDTYVDENAAHGVYYKYAVDAFSGESKSAYNTNGVEGMYFGTITEISAVATSTGAKITWGALEKATSYKVFRKTLDDSKWFEVAEVKGNSYEDNTIASGVLYYYMVKAYSGNNVAETTAAAPSVKYIAAPNSLVQNMRDGIKITITPVAGAEKYEIYKSVAGGKAVHIATLQKGNTEYIDADVEAYEEYSYTVYAVSGNLTSAGKTSKKIVRIGAPKDITLTNKLPGVQVTWSPVDDAVIYEVWRKEGNQKNWTKIAEVQSTTYTDGTVYGNEKYSYTISAITADGGNSGYNEDGATCIFLETPDLISIENANGGIQFTWSAVEGATSYTVYRKTSDTAWEIVGENVKTTSFVDKTASAGKTWTYTVRAVNGEYMSYFDSGLSITALSKPATPKLTKIANTASGAQVTWGAVKGADSYVVYRKTYNAKTKAWSGWSRIASGVTGASYIDKTAKSGTYYLYTVRAENSAGLSGYNTSGIKTYFLARPNPSVTNANSGVTVKWGKVAGATGYIVYRKTTGGWTNLGKTKGTSFTDKTAKSGVTYRYTVKAYYSSYASAYVSNGYAIRRLVTPTLKSVSSAKAGITFKWGKVTGATGYIVYRKTGNGGWQKIATVKGNSNVSYLDKSAKKGVTYTYTVRAYYGTSTSYYNTKGIACKDRY